MTGLELRAILPRTRESHAPVLFVNGTRSIFYLHDMGTPRRVEASLDDKSKYSKTVFTILETKQLSFVFIAMYIFSGTLLFDPLTR